MIGSLCAIAQGRISEQDIYELLTIPSFKTWTNLYEKKLVDTAPASALFFVEINYKKETSLNQPQKTARGTRIKSFVN